MSPPGIWPCAEHTRAQLATGSYMESAQALQRESGVSLAKVDAADNVHMLGILKALPSPTMPTVATFYLGARSFARGRWLCDEQWVGNRTRFTDCVSAPARRSLRSTGS